MPRGRNGKEVISWFSPTEHIKSMYLSDELIFKLDYLCEKCEMSMSAVMQNALDEYFYRHSYITQEEFEAWVEAEKESWRNFER